MNRLPIATPATPLASSPAIRASRPQPYQIQRAHGDAATRQAEFLRRFTTVVRVNPAAGEWFYQARERYGAEFAPSSRRLSSDHLLAHLTGAGWIASRAAIGIDGAPVADRVAFDLDLKREAGDTGERGLADLHAKYWRIRALMGVCRTPLVYGSPGGGLRISYAISPRPLRELVRGSAHGLVADVLTAAGVVIRSGRLEIFPQRKQSDRLPLGRGMPILDPETLSPVLGSSMHEGRGGRWTREERWAALEALERWRACPCDDLVEHLRTLRALSSTHAGSATGLAVDVRSLRRASVVDEASGDLHEVAVDESWTASTVPIVPGPALDAYVRRGVPAPGQRYATEFRVAMAFVASPERYAEFGLSATSTSNDEIALALVEWLARHHNGNSGEWQTAAAGGNVDRARSIFLDRYLARDPARRTIVDRARRALLWEQAANHPTLFPGREAFEALLAVAVTRFPATARRWGFVTWSLALQRVSRLQALRGRGLGAAVSDGAIDWQIDSTWAKAWPGGSGTYRAPGTGAAQTAYAAYLRVLEEAGLVELIARHVAPWDAARALRPGIDYRPPRSDRSDADRVRGECATYRVRLVGSVIHESDLPYRSEVLALAARNAPPRHGKPVSIDEVLHAAWAGKAMDRVKGHYGARQWEHVAVLQVALQKADRLLDVGSGPAGRIARAA